MQTISVIIITKNEEVNIVECVRSASFANEVIVIDSGSTDNTVMLAKKNGAKVIETDWPGYGAQKNRAIEASKGRWIFSLDADERITPKLASEILKSIETDFFKVFSVPRRSFYISKFMKHSGWSPDHTKRLFRRGYAIFSNHMVHEHLKTDQPSGFLYQPIIHYSYRNFETVLNKINEYSSKSAEELLNKGKRGSLTKAIIHGLWAFFRTYIIRAGFLDGKEGFMLSISNAEGVYYRYVKLMKLHEK